MTIIVCSRFKSECAQLKCKFSPNTECHDTEEIPVWEKKKKYLPRVFFYINTHSHISLLGNTNIVYTTILPFLRLKHSAFIEAV